MKEEIVESLGFNVPMLKYETIDEVNKDGNDTNAALEIVNDYLDFHGARDDARDLICLVVEEKTGVKRGTRPTDRKNAKGEVIKVAEKSEIYVERALATADGKVKKEDLQALITRRARGYKNAEGEDVAAIAVSAKPRPAGTKPPPKLGDAYKQAAEKLMAKYTDAQIHKGLSKYLTPETCQFARSTKAEDKDKNIETLGWLVFKQQKAKIAAGDVL